jgi:hypothetical protein
MPIAVGLGERRNSCGCPPCAIPCADWPDCLKITSVSNWAEGDGQVITVTRCTPLFPNTWGFIDPGPPTGCSNYDLPFAVHFSKNVGPCNTPAGIHALGLSCVTGEVWQGEMRITGNVPATFADPLMWRPATNPLGIVKYGTFNSSYARVFIDSISPFTAHTEILYFTCAPHPSIDWPSGPTYLCASGTPNLAACPWCNTFSGDNCTSINASAATLQFLIEECPP